MAEAAPVAATPSTTTQPTAPAAPAAPVPPSPEAARLAEMERELRRLQSERDAKVKEGVIERRKFAAEQKAARERLAKLEQLERREQLAKLNPEDFLKGIYGDNWYDTVVSTRMNGVPPAQLIASEIEKLREENRTAWSQRDAQQREAQERAAREAASRQMGEVKTSMAQWAEANLGELPALAGRLGDSRAVGEAIFAHARAAWDSTAKYDEAGNMVTPGKVLSFAEAARELEAKEVELLEKLAQHEKLRPRLTGGGKPESVAASSVKQQSAPSNQQQSRRTLSNDITGSTPGRQPATTAAEKRARAVAAFNALRKAT